MDKLISAFAKDYFAITDQAVHAYFPIAQAILNGTYIPAAVELVADEFEDVETEESIPQNDEFTGRIAVMSITGVLMHYGGACSYGAVDYATRIDAYRMDDTISGLIIKGDGPGGQVQGTKTLRESLESFAKVKPVILLVDDGNIASALVWALSPATEIYASNAICQVGSVGVMACFMDVRKAMEKQGISEVVIYAPQSVDKNKDHQDALDGKPQAVREKLRFLCEAFMADVADSRGEKLTSDEWNTGKMFFAADAQRIGLIDGIKNYPEVVARMQELIAQNQNPNNMLKRFPKVAALKGAETITAESLEAANEEIEAYGIPGVSLVLDAELEPLQAAAETIEGLNTTIATHVNTIGANATKITELEGKIVSLQAKLDGKPAEEPVTPKAKDDIIPATGAVEEESFETSTDREAAQMRDLLRG
ncbi:MAG: S49 family peptidase [Bacteroidota bacterium]